MKYKLSSVIEFDGLALTLKEWGQRMKIEPERLVYRLSRGWPIEKAFFTPTMTPKECGKVGGTFARSVYTGILRPKKNVG